MSQEKVIITTTSTLQLPKKTLKEAQTCLFAKKAIKFPDGKSKILWSQDGKRPSKALHRDPVGMFTLQDPGNIHAMKAQWPLGIRGRFLHLSPSF